MKYYFLLSIVFLFSCSSNKLTLYGEIGNGLKSTFELVQKGKNYSGIFFYNNDIDKSIKVKGFIENDKLILNEYNDILEITGTFKGTFDNLNFQGNWLSPDKKEETPFNYSISNTKTISKETITKNIDDEIYKLKINNTYQKWISKKVETGEYWTEDTYNKKAEINRKKNVHWGVDSEEETGECKYGIPSELSDYSTTYMDVNNDGEIDCISYVRWIYCSPGNWSNNVPSELLIFISKNNSYELFENPKVIEYGGIFKSVNEKGELEFEHLTFEGSEARCCPSIQWFTYYKYVNNGFILERKTSEKKKVY